MIIIRVHPMSSKETMSLLPRRAAHLDDRHQINRFIHGQRRVTVNTPEWNGLPDTHIRTIH